MQEESRILTRWAVVKEHAVSMGDVGAGRLREEVLLGWFADARSAYFELSPGLTAETRARRIRILGMRLRMGSSGSIEPGRAVWVAVSVTELRPSSFDMAFRVRELGGDGAILAQGGCSVEIAESDGSTMKVPEAIRQEILAIEANSASYS